MFTDHYAEQSCTAGRASLLTGQSGMRTGLTKVGLPGAALGLRKEDPTLAEILKDLVFLLVPAQFYVASFLATFNDYPQRQKAATFNLDEVLETMKQRGGSQ